MSRNLHRELKDQSEIQEEYLWLLRGLFKSNQTDKMLNGAYLTGILPIKKYGTQSALTDVREYTMVQPRNLARFIGFTEGEVRTLCLQQSMDFEEIKLWYDGYSFLSERSVYSPNSVIEAISSHELGTYWTQTETYESLKNYINLNFDGLQDAVTAMLGGLHCKVATRKFQNDMTHISSKDDCLTLLVHLGYLAYDAAKSEVYIPNQEVAEEFLNAVDDSSWNIISDALLNSDQLLEDTLAGSEEKVAQALDRIHSDTTSLLSYNDENSLSCVLAIAYYTAHRHYIIERESPAGKGYADLVFRPRRYSSKPAMIIELKWNKNACGAIRQIKEKEYPRLLEGYSEQIMLVGINYDKKTKEHECRIERI